MDTIIANERLLVFNADVFCLFNSRLHDLVEVYITMQKIIALNARFSIDTINYFASRDCSNDSSTSDNDYSNDNDNCSLHYAGIHKDSLQIKNRLLLSSKITDMAGI